MELEMDTVRVNLKDMLEACKDDVSYIQEHGDAVQPDRYLTELIALNTNQTAVLFALTSKAIDTVKEAVRTLSPKELTSTCWWCELTNSKPVKKHTQYKHYILVVESLPSPKTHEIFRDIDTELQKIGGTFSLFQRKELLYNPLKHVLVPQHRILTPKEKETLMLELNITNPKIMPHILKDDVIARWLRGRPGDVFEIIRQGFSSYRLCI